MKKLGKWVITLNAAKTELTFDFDGKYRIYAFYDMVQDVLFYDIKGVPPYIEKAAKNYAKANGMIDIYNT